MSGQAKQQQIRKSLLNTTALSAMAITVAVAMPGKANAVDANATPYGENVVGGSASFNRPSAVG